MAPIRKLERLAQQLLDEHGNDEVPIDVERIARSVGARLSFEPLDRDISGMLFRYDDGRAVIGVNTSHAHTRQRFSIAHELGHLLLHPGQPMFIDRTVRVNLRDDRSGRGIDSQEIEANGFAAALLMPEKPVRLLLQRYSAGREPDLAVGQLAREFDVSRQAMEHRLANLGLFQPQ